MYTASVIALKHDRCHITKKKMSKKYTNNSYDKTAMACHRK